MEEGIKSRPGFSEVFIEVGLLILSAFLFAFSFPSFISNKGLFPLGFLALVPLFIVVHRSGWVRVFLYGLLFGFGSYALFNYWLLKFHPLAIFIVPIIYALYFIMLFPLLKLADSFFPKYGYLVQIILWVAYEFIKTRGFIGYSYGIIGYTQYPFLPFIRIGSIFGIWGISFLVLYPSAYLGNALRAGFGGVKDFFRNHRMDIVAYGAVIAAVLIFGFAVEINLEDEKKWKVALIQHNVDPWKHDYEDALDILLGLSNEALAEKPDIVVWSETSFVPAIEYHTKYRQNRGAYELVRRLKDFLAFQEVPFVIGNDEGVLKRTGSEERIDYNAALLFEKDTIVESYRKTHLVPFTENFPFKKQLPRIYQLLLDADTHFWEKGTEYTVFEVEGIRFSTPICFEDTFGYLSREFVQQGADVIVNLTNDSWSYSVPAMMQHMSMAVFRAVENRKTVVRSTNGGITCIIDPNGKITAQIPPFSQAYLVDNAVVYTGGTTLYTRWGDWFGWLMVITAGIVMIAGIVLRMIRSKRLKMGL